MKVEKAKTKEFKKILSALKLEGKVLFVLDKIDDTLRLAARDLRGVELKRADGLNALDVLKFKKLVLTKPALSIVEKRAAGEK